MIKTVCQILMFCSILFSIDNSFSNSFLPDSIAMNVEKLLDFETISNSINNKNDKEFFYQSVSYHLYLQTLETEKHTKSIVDNYSDLINELEKRLEISPTIISHSLNSPIYQSHFEYKQINRKLVKSEYYRKQASKLKNQLLSFIRYQSEIINLCDDRIAELIYMLNEKTVNNIYGEFNLEKQLVVMNFTNLSDINKYEDFSSKFPEIISNRFKDRDDVSVMFSGRIDPDTEVFNGNNSDRYIVDGSFTINGFDMSINYKIYQLDNWKLISNSNVECDLRDIECIYDTFLWKFEQSLDTDLKGLTYDDFSNNEKKLILENSIKSNEFDFEKDDLFSRILEDFVIQKDYDFNLDYKGMDFSNLIDNNSKEFDLKKHPMSSSIREEMTKELIDIILNFTSNPYEISIGDIEMQVNRTDNAYVDLTVPVSYKIKKDELNKLIKNFKFNTFKSNNLVETYEFINDNYTFNVQDKNLIYDFDNEIFPVLFFTDVNGNIQKIIIDSWDSSYDNLLFGDYDVNRYELFTHLFNLLDSSNGILFNIKNSTQNINYKLAMPVSVLDNYTRLTVKIFTREELNKYLPVTELSY